MIVKENLRATKKEYAKTEDDLKSLQSVGQIIGEVLRPLDNERCKLPHVIISFFIFSSYFTPFLDGLLASYIYCGGFLVYIFCPFMMYIQRIYFA